MYIYIYSTSTGLVVEPTEPSIAIGTIDSAKESGFHQFNGNSRILKWRYCTICLAICLGDIPLHRPEK